MQGVCMRVGWYIYTVDQSCGDKGNQMPVARQDLAIATHHNYVKSWLGMVKWAAWQTMQEENRTNIYGHVS